MRRDLGRGMRGVGEGKGRCGVCEKVGKGMGKCEERYGGCGEVCWFWGEMRTHVGKSMRGVWKVRRYMRGVKKCEEVWDSVWSECVGLGVWGR